MRLNLELPLKHGQNISGHLCQGHVDTIGIVGKIKKVDKSKIHEFKINKYFIKYLIEKASILIKWCFLTISKVKKNSFEIWTIPHTLKLTNLSNLKTRDVVNIEIDILSKYIKKFINEKNKFTNIESIIRISKKGGMYILVDDENRENEGDLVVCSSDIDAKKINFMAKYGRGLICLALDSIQAKKLVFRI